MAARRRADAARRWHDLDLVEAAFVESFHATSDPVSFLRLAGVPFVSRDGDGRRLALFRVELSRTTDLGALTPALDGGEHRYDPLPAALVSHRARLGLGICGAPRRPR